ncbi:hypothetical protein P7C73_g6682, partial [Tremellales sp. Uapishka_1]
PPNGQSLPPPPLAPMNHQRVVSSPNPPVDFGPDPSSKLPTSQSMGFANVSRNAVADNPRQTSSPGLPRSASTPFDRLSPRPQTNGDSSSSSQGSSSPVPPSRESARPVANEQPAWLKEFTPVVELIAAQPQKTYVNSPPELEMIMARTSAGGQPKQGQPGSPSNDWDSVWLQLSGISLSMWSMKETRAAAAKGEKVPPAYYNITDSSLELLAPLPPPPHRPTSHPHRFVFSLNTAGSNRLLFSCPSERDLARWSVGLRLAAWERAKLEEIYTGHLIKSGGREPKNELVKGRLEGWVRVRVMGGVEWKRLWLVLSMPGKEDDVNKEDEKKGRRRSFFGLGADKPAEVVQEPNTGVTMASFYLEPRTPKNRTSVAVLTITNVTQAYAVFPERLEVMSQSNLMKVVGKVGGDMVTIEGRLRDSGWALIMPEIAAPEGPASSPTAPVKTPLASMMRWVTAFHDVFELYGRPERYLWDPRDRKSLFFAYPSGADRGTLFLNLDEAMSADFRASNVATIRDHFVRIALRKMQAGRIDEKGEEDDDDTPPAARVQDFRLPPLAFDVASPAVSDHSAARSLTPITEQSDIATRENSTRTNVSQRHGERSSSVASSKQMSGSSKAQGEDHRLPPINDMSEHHFGQLVEEPKDHLGLETPRGQQELSGEQPVSMDGQEPPMARTTEEPPREQPMARATQYPVEQVSVIPKHLMNGQNSPQSPETPTNWSQETGPSPTYSNGATPTSVANTVSPIGPISVLRQSGQNRQALPPVPPAAQAYSRPESPAHDKDSDSASSSKTQTLAFHSAVPAVAETERQVLSPQPRRVSSEHSSSGGGALVDEPAAMYLMNMVDEPQSHQPLNASPERPRPTIVTSINKDSAPATHESLGRKPSGARAPPPRKPSASRTLDSIDDAPSAPEPMSTTGTHSDLGDDASTYLAFLDQPPPTEPPRTMTRQLSPPIPVAEPLASSFAPSKAAAERRAKAEQAAAEQQRARDMPGGGRRRVSQVNHNESSGSEDEDEDEESPVLRTRQPPSSQSQIQQQSLEPQSVQRSTSRALPPVPGAPAHASLPYPQENRDSRHSYHTQPDQGYQLPAPVSYDRPRSRSPAQRAYLAAPAQPPPQSQPA